MHMIILTASQAEDFTLADTGAGAGLKPVPLPEDERWGLPARVLDDPAHAAVHAALAAFPVEDIETPE